MKPNAAKDKAMVGKVLHGCIYPSVTPNAVFLTPTMTQRGSSCNSTSLKDCGYSFFDYKIAADTDFLIRALYKYELKVKYLKRYIVRMRVWEDFQLIAPNEKPYGMKILLYSSMDFDPFLQK